MKRFPLLTLFALLALDTRAEPQNARRFEWCSVNIAKSAAHEALHRAAGSCSMSIDYGDVPRDMELGPLKGTYVRAMVLQRLLDGTRLVVTNPGGYKDGYMDVFDPELRRKEPR